MYLLDILSNFTAILLKFFNIWYKMLTNTGKWILLFIKNPTPIHY